MARRSILVAVGGRANYATLKNVIRECAHTHDVTVLCYAAAVSDRYGSVVAQVRDGGFRVRSLPSLIDGGTQAMTATAGATMTAVAPLLTEVRPDVVLVCGDRYDVLPIAYAAALQNIRVAHVMGGEVSGTIDEGIRHAITKLAHIHFPATEQARQRIIRLGEDQAHVHVVGCPRLDFVRETLAYDRPAQDPDTIVVSFHPVTTEAHLAGEQTQELLDAVLSVATMWGERHLIWPAGDAGSEAVIDALRCEEYEDEFITHRAMPPADYARLLARATVLVGNSSSAIREGAFIGVPAVDVGSRQQGRERGANVVHAEPIAPDIAAAIRRQLEHGPYDSDPLYGDGHASERIADVLAGELPAIQKRWVA